ncbi:LysR family transcriptional regulator [Rhodobacteraceae bacterium]|nr:LysR family transcriptional regulator [Paracoccaceae bacterium]
MNLTRRMKPAHLQLIQAIAASGKLQLAADVVGISQPAASRILTEMEKDAGAPLFERHPRGMVETALGAIILRHARVILAEMESLDKEVKHLMAGTAGEVRVGSVTGPASAVLVPALQQLRARSADIRPTVLVAPSATLVRGLEEGRFDFVIARIDAHQEVRDFYVYPGRTEQISLVVRHDHPLAGQKITLRDLRDFEFVVQESGSPIRQSLEQTFLRNGVSAPEIVTNSSSLLIALSMICGSDAIAPQTREVADMLTGTTRIGDGLVCLDLDEMIEVPPYMVIHDAKRQLTRLAEILLDEVLTRL